MSALPLQNYLVVGAILFSLGAIGFLARRNLIVMFLSAEMMLQGVAVNLVAFSRAHGNVQGQSFVLFIITIAACEAALAMALILMLYRTKKSLDVTLWQDLREHGLEPTLDREPLPEQPPQPRFPVLTPSGLEPAHREETSNA